MISSPLSSGCGARKAYAYSVVHNRGEIFQTCEKGCLTLGNYQDRQMITTEIFTTGERRAKKLISGGE